MRRLLALLLALWPAPGMAGDWQVAALSEDRRFLAHALTVERPEGWQAAVGRLAAGAGLDGRTQPLRLSLAPILTWDGNINAGLASDHVRLGPLVFTVDPGSRAVAGPLAGLSFGLQQVTGLRPGLGVTAEAHLSGAHALDRDLSVVRLSGEVCARADLGAWRFADLCLGQEITRRALATSKVSRAALTLTRMAGVGERQALRLGAEGVAGRWRPVMRLEDERVTGLGLVTLGLEAGQQVAGWQAMVSGQSLRLRSPLTGQPMGITLSHRLEAGGAILGLARADQLWSLEVERWTARGLHISVGYTLRLSSIDGFSSRDVTFGLDLSDLLRRGS